MDDDLNTSRALAVVHDLVREGNAALGRAATTRPWRRSCRAVRAMLDVLGLDPLDPQWATAGASRAARRWSTRWWRWRWSSARAARTRKDWAAADAVRDQLKQAGVVVEDTPHGPRWTIEGR